MKQFPSHEYHLLVVLLRSDGKPMTSGEVIRGYRDLEDSVERANPTLFSDLARMRKEGWITGDLEVRGNVEQRANVVTSQGKSRLKELHLELVRAVSLIPDPSVLEPNGNDEPSPA